MNREGKLVRSALLSPENLRELLEAVDAYGVRHALSARDLYPVKLALDELGTNLLVHGSLPNVQPELRLRLEHDTQRLQFVVQDNGRPFDPTRSPNAPGRAPNNGPLPVGGLGLTLVRGFVRRLAYSYENGWNELSLEYDRPSSPAG